MIDFGDAVLIMGVLGAIVGSLLVYLGLRDIRKREHLSLKN